MEMEMETNEYDDLINVNGFKNVFGVLTHLKNSFVSP
jgi:hypothetical protein